MTVGPINILRVSQNMRTDFVINSLRRTQRDLFVSQAQLATGRAFVTASEDPIRASRAVDLTRALAQQDQFTSNIYQGDNFLAASDSALTEVNELITRASVIANQTVGSLTTADERRAEAEIVAAIRQQLQTVGNRQFNGRYLFAGLRTTDRPFVDSPAGVRYVGDISELFVRVSEGLASPISEPGNVVFGALSDSIVSDAQLTPVLTADTRLDEMSSAVGGAIQRGVLIINEEGGAGAFTVDLTSADTIGDVVDLINEAASLAGAGLTATLEDSGISVSPSGSPVSITDSSAGVVAASLGLLQATPVSETLVGATLIPRVTRLTTIEALAGGAGIDLTGGLRITNGEYTADVDLSEAETVQDIINAVNNAGVFVLARINADGTGIDVFNQVSGSLLSIGENGGTTAAELGIRTFDTATPLDRLNFGGGVSTKAGEDDLRITAKDGSVVDVNLDTAETVGDVIDLINEAATAASVSVTALFAETGNGIDISDSTGGTGDLSVGILNLSQAAIDLGLQGVVTGVETSLSGSDVNLVRTEGVLDALAQLEAALRTDDTSGIGLAGGRLDTLRDDVSRVHGVIGARSQTMQTKLRQMEDAATTTEIFLSEVRDLDYTEAVTRMQAAMTQLQANLQTSSNLMGLSLMDFLG